MDEDQLGNSNKFKNNKDDLYQDAYDEIDLDFENTTESLILRSFMK